MKTKFITSSDGVRVAFDKTGRGPGLMLLHGGGQSKKNWHEIGYVERLKKDFTVISVDIRGNGESDKRFRADYYPIDRICEDLMAVADACNVQKFGIWGFSFGGGISRYLAARSDRVIAIAVIGVQLFGLPTLVTFENYIEDFIEKWQPLVHAYNQDQFPTNGTEDEKQAIASGNIPVWLGILRALRDWGPVEPKEMTCPILFAVGSENENVMNWIDANGEKIAEAQVQLEVYEGLNHAQEFNEIDAVFPTIRSFFKEHL